MEALLEGVRIVFEGTDRAEASRAAEQLRQTLLERVGADVTASINKDDPDSQDAGATLVVLFGSGAASAIAQGIRAYLARRGDDRDRVTIKTADGTELVATGEAARTLDAAALVRALRGELYVQKENRSRATPSSILFVASYPRNTHQLALDQECAAVERELKITEHHGDFRFISKWAVTVDDLARHLLEVRPTVVHFSGHGLGSHTTPASLHWAPNQRDVLVSNRAEIVSASGGVYLDDEMRSSQLVTARALAMLIKSTASSVRLVVLNACYSDGLADELCKVVDCVVGMTGAIENAAANSFAIAFYRALGNRRSVRQSVEHAVATMAAKQLPDELLPRCRTRSGVNAEQFILLPVAE